MELDSRIIEGKTYLDCFDTEIAKQFIGKECYFTTVSSRFKNLNDLRKATLTIISEDYDACYGSDEIGIHKWDYAHFILPCEWVKEPETVLRPLTNEEFLDLFDAGKLHSIRKKNERGRFIITEVYYSDYYSDCEKDKMFVKFNHCGTGFGMGYLLENNFEYLDDGEWKPFGVEIHK